MTAVKNQLLRPGQLTTIDGEPHVFDLHLAANLGMASIYEIRRTIAKNRNELEMYGELSGQRTKSTGGRPGKAYYLNEGQALVICALSKTPRAAEVRKLIIDVFMAWRRGKTVHVQEHYRTAPQRTVPADSTFDMVYSGDIARITMSLPIRHALAMARHYLELQ